jgi:hypothetical protein
MPSITEADRVSEIPREQTDLKREYRPIGIGAVAAALTVTGKHCNAQPRTAANSNERIGSGGSRAA